MIANFCNTSSVSYKGKRCIDMAIAMVGLTLFLPFILVSVSMLFLLSGGNPFFIQERIGLREMPFKVIKLKTLYSPHDALLYKIGLFLRSYSLDELPQFINVLKGDMSIVGPRPLLAEYLPLYNEMQRKRHAVKPGITGWAQINGRNSLSWEEKFTLDIWYVNNTTLLLDMKIIMHTLFQLLDTTHVKSEGLSEEEKFKGSSKQLQS